jgi:hypothetical protein
MRERKALLQILISVCSDHGKQNISRGLEAKASRACLELAKSAMGYCGLDLVTIAS